jgi:hypothetical protein
MGCSSSQCDFLSEYESKREELKSKYYSIQPNILNAGYVPNVGKQPNGNDSGKYKIDINKLRRKRQEYQKLLYQILCLFGKGTGRSRSR